MGSANICMFDVTKHTSFVLDLLQRTKLICKAVANGHDIVMATSHQQTTKAGLLVGQRARAGPSSSTL